MSSDEEVQLSPTLATSTPEASRRAEAANVRLDGSGDQNTSRVIHYKVELPPCFHGDGKDKESFSLWKARLELAVRACPASQQQDLATILPTRLSGDALAYWLSLPPATQTDYDACVSRLTDVFGGKQFLQHFQTFVNARQRMPKEPLEVFAAEITRLVFEAFPNYGGPAIAMERFRRFVAGLDPVLQVKCHEHGATTLEEALAVACKWERAQEALRLAQPQNAGVVPTTNSSSNAVLQPVAHLTAMVSTKAEASSDQTPDVLSAIKQLSAEVQTLKLAVTDLKRHKSSPSGHGDFRQRQRSPEWSPHRQGRAASRFSPHASPQRYQHYAESPRRGFSPEDMGYAYRHQSPDYRGRRNTVSPPSSPHHGHQRLSSGRDGCYHHRSPDYRRYGSSPPHRPARLEASGYSRGSSNRREYSPAGSRDRREASHERHHVSFTMEDRELQGNEW